MQTFDAAEESLLCVVIPRAAKPQPSVQQQHDTLTKQELSEEHPQHQGGQEQEQEFEEGEEEEYEEEEEEEALQEDAEHPIRSSGDAGAEEESPDYGAADGFLPPPTGR